MTVLRKLLHWDPHFKTIHVHEKQTAKSLRDRCLFTEKPEVRSEFGVFIKSYQGVETEIKDNDELGSHLKDCKFICFKPMGSTKNGFLCKFRMPVNQTFGDGLVSQFSSLELYWDIENCRIPKGATGAEILNNLLQIFGPSFKDISINIVCLRQQAIEKVLQMWSYPNVRIHLVDKKGGKEESKGEADTGIKELMFENSAKCKPGTFIALITGDKDFGSDLYKHTYKMGFFTVLIHKVPLDHDLLHWPTVSFCFDNLFKLGSDELQIDKSKERETKRKTKSSGNRNAQESSLEKIQETTRDRPLDNEALKRNKVEPEQQNNDPAVGELNFKLKCNKEEQDNGTCSSTLGPEDSTGLCGLAFKRIKVRFLNKEEELLVYSWDNVGILKQQLAYALIHEENLEINLDFISCQMDNKTIDDEVVIFELIDRDINREIVLTFGSVSVQSLQIMTFLGYNSPLEVKPLILSRNKRAVFLWDMTNQHCLVPENKNGLHIAKRVIDRFLFDCKIEEALFFSDEIEIKGDGVSFSFTTVVRNLYTKNSKSAVTKGVEKYLHDQGTVIVVITGNQELAQYIEGLKRTHPNIILIPTLSITDYLSAPAECTYEDLTRDLPDNPHTIKDPKKIVAVKAEVETGKFKNELRLKFCQSNAYTNKNSYSKGIMQTKESAENFKKIMDGSKICGSLVKAFLADEDDNIINSSPQGTAVPPLVDVCYQGNLNVVIKKKPPGVKDVRSSQCEPTDLLPNKPTDEPKQPSLDDPDTAKWEKSSLPESDVLPLMRSHSQETQANNDNDDLMLDGPLENLSLASSEETTNLFK